MRDAAGEAQRQNHTRGLVYGGQRHQNGAFTLIELLVSISIISLMVTLLLPVLEQARATARAVQCRSNLRQFGVYFEVYAQTYDNRYPYATSQPDGWTEPFHWPRDLLEVMPKGSEDNFDMLTNVPTDELGIWNCPENGHQEKWRRFSWPRNGSYTGHGWDASDTMNDTTGNRFLGAKRAELIEPSVKYALWDGHKWRSLAWMNTGNDLAFGTNPTQDSLVSNRRGIDDVMYLHPNRSANMLHADGHVEPKRFPLMGEYDRFGAESSPLGSWEQEDL